MALLDTIVRVLPAAQRLAVRELLSQKKRVGEIRSPREEFNEATRLLQEIQSNLGGQIFNPIFAISNTRISSEDHNKNMEGIFIDLNGLYAQVDAISVASATKTTALQSDYLKSRAAIEKLINDARTFAP